MYDVACIFLDCFVDFFGGDDRNHPRPLDAASLWVDYDGKSKFFCLPPTGLRRPPPTSPTSRGGGASGVVNLDY